MSENAATHSDSGSTRQFMLVTGLVAFGALIVLALSLSGVMTSGYGFLVGMMCIGLMAFSMLRFGPTSTAGLTSVMWVASVGFFIAAG